MNCYAASSYDSQMSPSNLSPLLNILPPTITTTPCNTTESSIAGSQETKPLNRKRNEMKENLLVLEVQIIAVLLANCRNYHRFCSVIRDFGKQNTRGNVSKISVGLTCY